MDTLTLDKQALAKLTEGIVLLDDQGRPLTATRSSQPWLRHCIEIAPVLAGMIAESKQGALTLPAAVELRIDGEEAGDAPEAAWLVANAHSGHALLIQPRLLGKTRALAGERRVLNLLGVGVREEISRLGAMLRECGQSAGAAAPTPIQSTHLDTLLGEISELADLHQRDQIFFEERLSLPALLREIIIELRRPGAKDSVDHVLECSEAPPPGPVYGNAHWMKKALLTLLAGVEQGRPRLSHLKIHLRQFGDFVVLGASVSSVRSDPAPVARASPGAPQPAPPRQALRMSICRRIIDLHGGQLNLRMMAAEGAQADAGGAVESFTLTLPTGLPARDRSRLSCAECRINYQAMQYARDLAKIMALPPSSIESHEKGAS